MKIEKEKPCFSSDSDLRSSDFMFSSGAVSVANNGEKDERLVMMNHTGEEYSKEGQVKRGRKKRGRKWRKNILHC